MPALGAVMFRPGTTVVPNFCTRNAGVVTRARNKKSHMLLHASQHRVYSHDIILTRQYLQARMQWQEEGLLFAASGVSGVAAMQLSLAMSSVVTITLGIASN